MGSQSVLTPQPWTDLESQGHETSSPLPGHRPRNWPWSLTQTDSSCLELVCRAWTPLPCSLGMPPSPRVRGGGAAVQFRLQHCALFVRPGWCPHFLFLDFCLCCFLVLDTSHSLLLLCVWQLLCPGLGLPFWPGSLQVCAVLGAVGWQGQAAKGGAPSLCKALVPLREQDLCQGVTPCSLQAAALPPPLYCCR